MLKAEGIPDAGHGGLRCRAGDALRAGGSGICRAYVNRVDAQGGDGIQTVVELQQLLTLHAPQSSVRWPRALKRRVRRWTACWQAASPSRCRWTYAAEHSAVDAAIVKFEQDWQGAFGRTSI